MDNFKKEMQTMEQHYSNLLLFSPALLLRLFTHHKITVTRSNSAGESTELLLVALILL